MNKEEIKQLKEKIKDFENKDVFVEIQQAIQFHTTLNKAKIIVSNEKLIISDEKNQDFILELQYLEDIETEDSTINLQLSNALEITMDY